MVIVCKLVMEPIGEGNGNTLQCSCLESPVDRGAWWDVIYRVAQSWTRLKQLSSKQQQQWNPLKQGGTIIQGNANKHFVCFYLGIYYFCYISPHSQSTEYIILGELFFVLEHCAYIFTANFSLHFCF